MNKVKHASKVKHARRVQTKKEAKIKGENGSIFNSSAWNVRRIQREKKEIAKMEAGVERRRIKKEVKQNK